jgi:hypothetical protein
MGILVASTAMGLALTAVQAALSPPDTTPPFDVPPAAAAPVAAAASEPASAPAAPAPTASPGPGVTAPTPVGPTELPDTKPVVRAGPGNWGMTFIFGGLAPLSVAGLGNQALADGLIFTEIGVRRVFERVVVPFSFGAGVTHRQTAGASKPTVSAGLSASVAVLKGFRVWRRIAPYFGGFLHTHYVDAAGPNNWLVNVSVGPILGIEYYLGDRVSLYGQGIVGIGPSFGKDTVQWVARTAIAAGGQLGLTFYF